jgi:hypothetical protein
MTVRGFAMNRISRQPDRIRDSTDQISRSRSRFFGRFTDRWYTAST